MMVDIFKGFVSEYRMLSVQYIVVSVLIWTIGVCSPYISGLYIDYLVSGTTKAAFLHLLLLLSQ